MQRNHQNSPECGAIIVEFALLLPLLLLLLAGTVAFGLLFYNKQVVTNASREGARYGIHYSSESEIKTLVGNYCVNQLITYVADTVVIIKVDGELGTFGTPLTVTVSYDYKFLIPGLIGLGTTLQMSAETMMRMERALSPS
mgnify:CR=1 FL=1